MEAAENEGEHGVEAWRLGLKRRQSCFCQALLGVFIECGFVGKQSKHLLGFRGKRSQLCLCINHAIARGLGYYTGTIYETFLTDKRDIGSVCSGGRYDNLASLYTKQQLPGVGASLGLDRLLAAMEELDLLPKVQTPAKVFVAQFDAKYVGDYQRVASRFRDVRDPRGVIGAEVFPEPKKIGQQLQYAEKRGFAIAIIAT